MRKFIFGFLLGVVAGGAGYWYYSEGQNRNLKQDLAHSTEAVEEKAKKAGAAIADATTNARVTAAVKARLSKELGLSPGGQSRRRNRRGAESHLHAPAQASQMTGSR